MASAATKNIITKFEATGCLANRLRSERPDTSATVKTVWEEMDTLGGSSTHREVSARHAAVFQPVIFGEY
jgi:hypothetical protein